MTLPSRTSSACYKSGATVVARQIAPTPDTPEEISVPSTKQPAALTAVIAHHGFFFCRAGRQAGIWPAGVSPGRANLRSAQSRGKCRAEAPALLHPSPEQVERDGFLENAATIATGRFRRSKTKASRGGRTQILKASICASRDSRPGGPKDVSPRREPWVDNACPFPCPSPARGRGN